MSVALIPNEHFRRAFKLGMSGWDVRAFQIGLASHRPTKGLIADGYFGPKTEALVIEEQRNHHLTEDGVAGLLTQRAMATTEALKAEQEYVVPRNLITGLIEGESGFAFAAATPVYPNGSRDVGAFQYNLSADQLKSEAAIYNALVLKTAAGNVAERLRKDHDRFYGKTGAKTHRMAWELAVLAHNWPSAAENISNGFGPYVNKNNDAPIDWIVAIGVHGVETPNQWVRFYIDSKTVYVKDWTS